MAFQQGLSTGIFNLQDEDGNQLFCGVVLHRSNEGIEALKVCKARDLPWHTDMCNTAAVQGKIDVLQWMVSSGCPVDLHTACDQAISGDTSQSTRLYVWLTAKHGPWSSEEAMELMESAGITDQLELAQTIRRDHNAPWPQQWIWNMAMTLDCWPLRIMKWAFANGATFGELWRCQEFADDCEYQPWLHLERTKEVFEWAHQQDGCPCTCNDADLDSD